MGGDQGPRLVVEATQAFLRSHPDASVTLVGDINSIDNCIPKSTPESLRERIAVLHAADQVGMDEKASNALRYKQGSSMYKAVELVAERKADACVSAGNTGALMAFGCKLIKTFNGVRRPAICKQIPTTTGSSLMLDLGANINCTAEQLVQFAVMGSAQARIYGVAKPRVALLNIGVEWSKGSEAIIAAAKQLHAREDVVFTGFIEGHDLYTGKADVIVCDGLVGNVALKVSEGMIGFVLGSFNQTLKANAWNRMVSWAVQPILRNWRRDFNTSRYNGAAMLGLLRTVVKSHGSADVLGFEHALHVAVEQVQTRIPERIEACLVN